LKKQVKLPILKLLSHRSRNARERSGFSKTSPNCPADISISKDSEIAIERLSVPSGEERGVPQRARRAGKVFREGMEMNSGALQ
jgi:hypothetical protein